MNKPLFLRGSRHSKTNIVIAISVSVYLMYLVLWSRKTVTETPKWETYDLRYRIAQEYPYTPGEIERNIWQSWKTSDLPRQFVPLSKSWTANTPSGQFRHTVMNDTEVDIWVHKEFATIPEILYAYDIMPTRILQIDFFRYLIVLANGGTYSDIDTSAEMSLDQWATYHKYIYGHKNTLGLVVGIENEYDTPGWRGFLSRRVQFCQWTVQGKRGHPMLVDLVATITERALKQYNAPVLQIGSYPYNFTKGSSSRYGGILEWTGPGAYTDAIYRYLNFAYTKNTPQSPVTKGTVVHKAHTKHGVTPLVDPNLQYDIMSTLAHPVLSDNLNGVTPENPIGWQNFTMIKYPILFGDVLVLPKHFLEGGTYVKHGYYGTWKGN